MVPMKEVTSTVIWGSAATRAMRYTARYTHTFRQPLAVPGSMGFRAVME